jgi:hypothetical protein
MEGAMHFGGLRAEICTAEGTVTGLLEVHRTWRTDRLADIKCLNGSIIWVPKGFDDAYH